MFIGDGAGRWYAACPYEGTDDARFTAGAVVGFPRVVPAAILRLEAAGIQAATTVAEASRAADEIATAPAPGVSTETNCSRRYHGCADRRTSRCCPCGILKGTLLDTKDDGLSA